MEFVDIRILEAIIWKLQTSYIFWDEPTAEVPQILYIDKSPYMDKNTCCHKCDMRSNTYHAVILYHYVIKSDVLSTIGICPCEVTIMK